MNRWSRKNHLMNTLKKGKSFLLIGGHLLRKMIEIVCLLEMILDLLWEILVNLQDPWKANLFRTTLCSTICPPLKLMDRKNLSLLKNQFWTQDIPIVGKSSSEPIKKWRKNYFTQDTIFDHFTFSILLKCVKVHTYIIKLLIFCLYGKTWTKDIASRTFLCLISVVYSSPTYFITKLPCWPEIYQETPLSALLCHIIWTNWQLFAWFFSIEVVFQLPVNERWAFYLLRLLIETTYFWQVQQKSSCEASIYWHQYCEVSLAICLVFLKE